MNNYLHQTLQRASISPVPGGEAPSHLLHSKAAPTSPINGILMANEAKTRGQEASEAQGGVGRCTSILAGSCLLGSLITAKQSTGQPSHCSNYVFCLSSASRAPIKPAGWGGFPLERWQYASKQEFLMSWPLLLQGCAWTTLTLRCFSSRAQQGLQQGNKDVWQCPEQPWRRGDVLMLNHITPAISTSQYTEPASTGAGFGGLLFFLNCSPLN